MSSEAIIEACQPKLAEAEASGKFLYETTNQVYFAPSALRRLQAEGRFIWGPVNFTLFDPARLETDPFFANFSGYRD